MVDRVANHNQHYDGDEQGLLAAASFFEEVEDEWQEPPPAAQPPQTDDMLLEQLETPAMRAAVRSILNNPDQAHAAAQLRQMLRPNELMGENHSVIGLLSMLGSADATERRDGERLLGMLNNPQQSELGRRLLNMSMNPPERHQLIEMLHDPAQRASADRIASLLSSENITDNRAGSTILGLLTSADAPTQADGRALLTMMNNAATRADALTIASNLDSPAMCHQMLQLLNNPAQANAARQVLAMLRSEEQQGGATNVLELLSSRFPTEQQDGQQIIAMLNNPQQQELGARLANVYDAERRHLLIEMAKTERGQVAAAEIIAMQNSPERRVRQSAERIFEWLESPNAGDQRVGADLVELLGNPAHQATVRQMLARLDDVQLPQMIDIVKSGRNPAGTAELVRMLSGTQEERDAVYKLLDLRAGRRPGNFDFGGKKPPLDVAVPSTAGMTATAERLIDMLGTPAQRATAITVLRRVENPAHMNAMVTLLADRTQERAANQIMRMLNSSNYQEHRGANALLQMLATEPPPIDRFGGRGFGSKNGGVGPQDGAVNGDGVKKPPRGGENGDGLERNPQGEFRESPEQRAARRILVMLNSQEQPQVDRAQQMLTHLSTPEQIQRMLSLHDTAPATAQALQAMLNDPARAGDALRLFDNLDASRIQPMLTLLNNPEQRTAAQALLGMLPDSRAAVQQLLDSANTEPGRQLLAMLNNVNDTYTAQQVMETRLDNDSRQTLLRMLSNPAQRTVAHQLLSILSNVPEAVGDEVPDRRPSQGAINLLAMLSGPGEQMRRDGERLLGMLSSTTSLDRQNGLAIMTALTGPDQYHRMFQLMDDPAHKTASQNILQMMRGSESNQNAARDLLTMLTGAQRVNGERLLSMLNEPLQAPVAISIMTLLPTSEQRNQMLTLLYTPGRQVLAHNMLSLLRNGTGNEQRHVASLLNRMGQNDQSAQAQVNMLSSAQFNRNLFSRLSTPAQIDQMMQILNSPGQRQAAAQLTEMLNSDSSAQQQAVRNLLDMVSSRAGGGAGGQLIDMLNTPAKQAQARRILEGTQSAEQAQRLMQMIAAGGEPGQTLLRMIGDPQQRPTAQMLLNNLRSDSEIALMLRMTNNPNQREAADTLMRMLGDDEQRFIASRFLDIMASNPEIGRQLLTFLNDEDGRQQEIALDALRSRLSVDNIGRLMTILNDPQHREAASYMISLLRQDDFANPTAIDTLLTMLGAAGTRMEGERLLAMMGDSRRRYAALRTLDNRPQPSLALGGKKS